MLINDAGVVIRMSVEEISLIGRSTQGVRLMRVDDDTKVVCVAKIVETENDDEELEGCAEQEDGQAPKAEETPEAEPESEKTE